MDSHCYHILGANGKFKFNNYRKLLAKYCFYLYSKIIQVGIERSHYTLTENPAT